MFALTFNELRYRRVGPTLRRLSFIVAIMFAAFGAGLLDSRADDRDGGHHRGDFKIRVLSSRPYLVSGQHPCPNQRPPRAIRATSGGVSERQDVTGAFHADADGSLARLHSLLQSCWTRGEAAFKPTASPRLAFPSPMWPKCIEKGFQRKTADRAPSRCQKLGFLRA